MLLPFLALAPSAYRIVDLGVPEGAEKVEAMAINNRGEVLLKAGKAFLWREGHFLALGEPTDAEEDGGVEPRALNDYGAVVGGFGNYAAVFGTGLPGSEAFLWKGQEVRRLFEKGRLAEARGINDRGDVVGRDFERGFVWSGGKVREIPALSHVAAGNRSDAVAINERGLILGSSTYGGGTKANYDLSSRPYLADMNTLRPHALPLPSGSVDGMGLDLNDAGLVLARAFFGGRRFTPYLVRQGRIVRLDYPEQKYFEGRLNGRGDVVGTIDRVEFKSVNAVSRPALWRSGRRESFPSFSGWRLVTATGINDRGQICGTGVHEGKTRAYVLTPFRGFGGRR